MDVRMIAVALRCRRRGLALPTVGVGQWFDHIRHNFNQPDFKLARSFPGSRRPSGCSPKGIC